MGVRVPRQSSTKWWILLAAIVATALTWLEHRDDPPRPSPRPAVAPDHAPSDGAGEGFVEFEITE